MALVVIGGVAAGLSAASRARRIDPKLEIIVLEKGPDISYGACGLPYFIEGRVKEPSGLIVYTPEYFRKERRIDVRTNSCVVSISHPRRELMLESGARVPYEKLVIATGARCDTSGIAGADQPHVFTMHTLKDAERMRAFLRARRPKRAVVVGAGYIGVEAADALRRNGLQVTVLERSLHALLRDDPYLTEAVRKQLTTHGVELRTGVSVSEVPPCDIAVIATGFKPNVELAAEAGVQVGRTGAIAVDDRMETNIRGIFAAGDCVEVTHLVSGRPTWIPLGTTANKTGRVAGACAAGARERFPGIVGTSIVSIFGMAFATTGFSAAQAKAEGFDPITSRIDARTRASYYDPAKTSVELIADRAARRLIGATIVGDDSAAGRINVVATALQARMKVEEFAQLDLSYSPPFAPTWDPLLIAAKL
jgi:NADPH-dependent 2,4-dienoyl-CoA reductase/sulfur reductase-like enzyme